MEVDLSCPSLKKPPRESLRLVCMFLDDPKQMYAVLCFHRPGNDFISGKDIKPLLESLKQSILHPATEEPDEEEATSETTPGVKYFTAS